MLSGCATPTSITNAEFELFRKLIQEKTGIALKETKRTLVSSRLARRLNDLGLDSLTAYYRVLRTADPQGAEMRHMINCITTNKTSFFREPEHFPYLAEHFRAALESGGKTYRVWSSACSTGEEPHSIAITLLEALHNSRRLGCASPEVDVRILASDIDTNVLNAGEEATYPLESISTLDENLRRRYFLCGREEATGLVQVKPEVRELSQFRRINLIEDPWPIRTKFNAIFCRNVIIYFDRETQHVLFERLLEYLAPDGLLFVGHSETLYWLTDVLEPVSHAVYRSRL